MILQVFLESFFAKMAYWLYSFKSYFSVIAINRPKSEATKMDKVSGSLSANGNGCIDKSREYRISSFDNAVLGYVSRFHWDHFRYGFYKHFQRKTELH